MWILVKSSASVLLSRDGWVTANIDISFGLRHVTNKLIINVKWRKCKKVINKGKYKNTKFNLFLNYCTHNKNEIKWSSKIRMKAKGTSWNWNMKDNVMARYCHDSIFLYGVSFEWHEEFQIIFSLWVQFSEPVAKTYFLSMEFFKLPSTNFGTYFFIFFSINL